MTVLLTQGEKKRDKFYTFDLTEILGKELAVKFEFQGQKNFFSLSHESKTFPRNPDGSLEKFLNHSTLRTCAF